MRVCVALAIALLLVVGGLLLDMSGRAPRLAATDHTNAVSFVAALYGGQELCQPHMVLPSEAARLQVLVGTYGRLVPELGARFFVSSTGRTLTAGILPAGAKQGYVYIPIAHPHGPAVGGTLCIRADGIHKIVLGGAPFATGTESEKIDGRAVPGRIYVDYMRAGSESWWQLLPTLDQRFGLGKSPVFGDWTFVVLALLLLGVWIATVRLLLRELA